MADTVRVRRANVLLDVRSDEVKYYLGLGYDILDDSGKVVEESVPNDLHTLQNAYVKNKETITQLKAEIAKLESKISEFENSKKATKAEKEVVETKKRTSSK